MKKLLLMLSLTLSIGMIAQTKSESTLQEYGKHKLLTPKAGSCASPDGTNTVTTVTPPSHAWLDANGYCYPAAYGTNPTVCWTFTPTSSSVTLNSGYSTTGCANISHGPFELYDASCTLIGTGLNFTGLTPGVQYTWCMTSSAWGGGPGCIGFTDYCPYYFNNVVLPVEFISFDVNCNGFTWSTASEVNNDYFTIYHSYNGYDWNFYKEYPGNGNNNTFLTYDFYDEIIHRGYYKLTQTDFNGTVTELSTKYINCLTYNKKDIEGIWTIDGRFLGTKLPSTSGLYIIKYKDTPYFKRGIIKY